MDELISVSDDELNSLERDGGVLLRGIFDHSEVQQLCEQLDPLLQASQDSASIRNRAGLVYAARNVLQLWPEVFQVSQKPQLRALLYSVLGQECGLVRVLYFDKPPGQTWALPWHKDVTIAVRPPENRDQRGTSDWDKVRLKAGVPHVEADEQTLSQMVTLRIHLDPALTENGALCVSPGSHHAGKTLNLDARRRMVIADAGDVWAMRPMLSHCSGQSTPDTPFQRRILHLEFSASRVLPHGFRWYNFVPVDC